MYLYSGRIFHGPTKDSASIRRHTPKHKHAHTHIFHNHKRIFYTNCKYTRWRACGLNACWESTMCTESPSPPQSRTLHYLCTSTASIPRAPRARTRDTHTHTLAPRHQREPTICRNALHYTPAIVLRSKNISKTCHADFKVFI